MAILSIDRNGVKCAWLVKGDIKEKTFPSVALTKANSPDDLKKLLSAIAEEEGRGHQLGAGFTAAGAALTCGPAGEASRVASEQIEQTADASGKGDEIISRARTK